MPESSTTDIDPLIDEEREKHWRCGDVNPWRLRADAISTPVCVGGGTPCQARRQGTAEPANAVQVWRADNHCWPVRLLMTAGLCRFQRLRNVRNDVFPVLEADREAHVTGGDAGCELLLGCQL